MDERAPDRLALTFAWVGAGVFVVSLVWFLYCYLVRWGPVDGELRATTVIVDVVLFTVFALHHSVFAKPAVKHAIQQRVPHGLERSVYSWTASLLFIAVCVWWQPVAGTVYRLTGVWSLAAYAIQAIAIILTIRASNALDSLDLAGVRPVVRAARPAATPEHVPLETGGLYGFVRHPLYFAWALFVFATPEMTGTRAVFAIVSTAYLAIAIPWEERSLVALFGDRYESYRKRVRWRMLPGLY